MEPAPEETLTIRGVPMDFLRSGAKASTTKKGPVALVRKHIARSSAALPVELLPSPPTPALLTIASSLTMSEHGIFGVVSVDDTTYLPCLLSTAFAAAAIESALATSSSITSHASGSCLSRISFIAASPLSAERHPRRTYFDRDNISEASSNPIPPGEPVPALR